MRPSSCQSRRRVLHLLCLQPLTCSNKRCNDPPASIAVDTPLLPAAPPPSATPSPCIPLHILWCDSKLARGRRDERRLKV